MRRRHFQQFYFQIIPFLCILLANASLFSQEDQVDEEPKKYSQEEVDKFIKDMVKGGLSVRDKVLADSKGVMKDMKVFRDGGKNGVVFLYTYKDGVTVNKSMLTPEKIKESMMPQLKGDKNSRLAFDMGIHTKLIYQSAEGKVYGSATINAEDIKKQLKVDKFIKDMVKGGLSVRDKVLADSKGIMGDMKVFRDGQKNGVVFQYIYNEGVTVDTSLLTPEKIKESMIPRMKGDKNSRYALDLGIYVRLVFQSAEGKVYGSASISKKDIKDK